MSDTGDVTCASGCDTTGPAETMLELEGGMYQCAECTGAAIAREDPDEAAPYEVDSLPQLDGDPDEAAHRGSRRREDPGEGASAAAA
ncbi:hypothetical protein [Streptomyces sp. NPDC060366]|uniref:hypothetical protein n=1 Tax=Streptomyces sp. NPDC060366 TaxID=3347105 RepID=UPI00364D5D45